MAHFLRDQQIANLNITGDNLSQICAVFADRALAINAGVIEDDTSGNKATLSFVIRFDNKGYRVFSITDLLRYFNQAKSVERVIFSVETRESFQTNRQFGTVLELKLDELDRNGCFLTATSDDRDWVDASFSAVQETLLKCKTHNGWARTTWTPFGVQLVGVTLGFIVSLWAASKVAPKLTIENSFIFSFLFVLLIFSNTWTFVSQQVLRLINFSFPNIKFLRRDKERLHWLLQAVIGGAVGAAVLFILGQVSVFLLEILDTLANKKP
jgi:hypothetical protein